MILTSFVGPFGASASATVRGAQNQSVLPLTLRSDLGLSADTFRTQAKLRGWCATLDARVKAAIHHPNKLLYAGCTQPAELSRRTSLAVMLDDAGYLTRHLPLDLTACEPLAAWRGQLDTYLAAVRQAFDSLGVAIRRAIPMSGVRLLAAEVFDTTPLTAVSSQPPHRALRASHDRWFGVETARDAIIGPQWEPCYSCYHTAAPGTDGYMTRAEMVAWIERCPGWIAVTPLAENDHPAHAETFARDLRDATLYGAGRGRGVVIWANPRTRDAAAAAADLVSRAIVAAPPDVPS